MRLSNEHLKNVVLWKGKGFILPEFDLEAVAQRTREKPVWLHFGAGNIFRAFPAVLQQNLLNKGLADTGIIVSEAFDEEILDRVYRKFDNLSIAVTLKSTGEIRKEIIASVTESVKPRSEYQRMVEICTAPSLQMITFTITEKGYAVVDANNELLPWIKDDLQTSADAVPKTTIGILTRLCYERYKAGKLPIALVSMDNCSHNGTLLKEAVMTFVENGSAQGVYDTGFEQYIQDERLVTFNWSMIDKITPRPAEAVLEKLQEDGIEEMDTVKTEKNTFVAPFVNAEELQYLAVEDSFPNGRPLLEKTGVLFSTRKTIDKIEKMKVCTCLNPLHTVLAVFGCLLGYTSISKEMENNELKSFIEQVGYIEGMPVVVDPGIIHASNFIRETIEVRFPNPFVPDTPQRIATDTSKKIPVRFGETLNAYIREGKNDLSFLTFIPLFFAGWLRYLMGIDDQGKSFELSYDPNLTELQAIVSEIKLGDSKPFSDKLKKLLERSDIFGIDLYEHNLGAKVEDMFEQLLSGKGAVQHTLRFYLDHYGKNISNATEH